MILVMLFTLNVIPIQNYNEDDIEHDKKLMNCWPYWLYMNRESLDEGLARIERESKLLKENQIKAIEAYYGRNYVGIGWYQMQFKNTWIIPGEEVKEIKGLSRILN